MSERNELLKREGRNWDEIYSKYDLAEIPWHSDKPDRELIDLIENKIIKPCVVLDLGCGAGTDAIYLASKGFEVIALDISQEAIRIAKERAENAGVKVKFIVGNFLEIKLNAESFDFINDRGCFHHIETSCREDFAIKINRILKPNGYYYLRCWSDKEEERERGPYRISEDDIKNTFSKYFKVGAIKDFRFGGKGARGYVCLMKKEVHE
jgi:ubiquinone/menaquinone biosynthesis C-methylase UbiE